MAKRWYHSMFRRFSTTRPGSFLLQKTLSGLDRWMFRRSKGKRSVSSILTGLPVVTVVTIGAKSGLKRSSPLLAIPLNDRDYILIASNFGRARHPAWYHNLRANPQVAIIHENQERTYNARQAEGDEREALWQRAVDMYRGYANYARRTERTIPVIVLEARDDEHPEPASAGPQAVDQPSS